MLIEAWGRGIEKICKSLKEASLQPPKFEEKQGGMLVSVMRNTSIKNAQVPPKYRPSTAQVEALLSVLGDGEYSTTEIMKLLNLSHRRNFTKFYLNPAIEAGIIEPIFPNQPRHPRQKYRRKN